MLIDTKHTQNVVLSMVVSLAAPRPESTESIRKGNQVAFKKALIARYPHCTDPQKPSVLMCMVLKHFFSADKVKAGHIIGLTNTQTLALIGLSNGRYCVRNGLFLYRDINRMYGNQQIVSSAVDFHLCLCIIRHSSTIHKIILSDFRSCMMMFWP